MTLRRPRWRMKNGKRIWRTGVAVHRDIETVNGRWLAGSAFSSFDVVSLHAANGAPNIRFDLITAKSSSRRSRGKAATEIMADIQGDIDRRASQVRTTLVFEDGTAALTGVSLVLLLAALLGLDGQAPTPPGLYIPESLWQPEAFLKALIEAGAVVTETAR